MPEKVLSDRVLSLEKAVNKMIGGIVVLTFVVGGAGILTYLFPVLPVTAY